MLSFEKDVGLPSHLSWLIQLPISLKFPIVFSIAFILLVLVLVGYFGTLTFYRVIRVNILQNDRFNHLPQPKHKSKYWWFLFGDVPEIRDAEPGQAHIKWSRDLQSDVYVYRRLFYKERLLLADPKAMNYVLGQQNSYDFPKPEQIRKVLVNVLGNGLLVAEGEIHKRQRKIIQPAFNVSAIRALTPLLFKHANAFVKKLEELVDQTKGSSEQPFIEGQSVQCARESKAKKPALDITHWFSRLTLDVIGDAGFDHQFDAVRLPIDQQNDTIVSTFRALMYLAGKVSIVDLILISLEDIFKFDWPSAVPTSRRKAIQKAKDSLDRTGKKIIERKRNEVQTELKEFSNSGAYDEKTFFEEQEENKAKSKDLLYLMIKANMAPGVKEGEKMNDAELLGQITTLLTAGHETISTLLTWFVYLTSEQKSKHILVKLRSEIEEHFAGRDELDYDALMAMPYLDNCCKEVLRLISPVVHTERIANRDDVIPLSKSYRTRDGKSTFNSIVVKKGETILIPIQVLNQSINIWGSDADEFRPDRWDDIPRMAKETGFPLHILSFIEGPRGCIGNRFAIAEFKAILCTFLRSFDYESLGWKIEPKQGIVVRPRIVGQEELGTQLPIRLQRHG